MKSLEAEESVAAENKHLKERFLALELDFHNTAYSLSFIRDKLNENFTLSCTVTDRTVKQMIIELYGGDACFTYPSNKQISQMLFLTGRDPQGLVEAMHVSSVQQVATTLAQELKDYRFGLEESFGKPRDLQLPANMLLKNPPATWEKFCSHLFRGRQVSRVKTNIVFKELVTALNRHGIYASYNSVRRIDADLAECIISIAGATGCHFPLFLKQQIP